MKNFSRFSVLALLLMAFAGSAYAVDLSADAKVDIIDGITIVAGDDDLNFGQLVLNDGSVVIATDGSITDSTPLIMDNSACSAGNFVVESLNGTTVIASAVQAAGGPAGLTLSDFTFSWAGGADNATHTINDGNGNVSLDVGGNLTLDNTAAVTGGVTNVPYTLSVVFQ